MVAALDALRELDLLRGGEQVDLADVLEEELQRVGRDLARLLRRLVLLVLVARRHDLDLELFERVVEVVDLGRLEIELVERDRDLVGAELAVLAARVSRSAFASSVSSRSDDALRCGAASSVALTPFPPRGTGFWRCRTVPVASDKRHRPNGSSL